MKQIKSLLLGVLCCSTWMLTAQPLDTIRGYSCDFEDPAQNLTWHMPKASGVGHQWCIDTVINNGGKYSMYVTADDAHTPSYCNQSAFVVAYTDIILRKSSDKYFLSFDWLAAGYTFLENDGLYVFWVPAVDPDLGDSIDIKSLSTTAIPDALSAYAIPLDIARDKDYLRGKSTWQAFLSEKTTHADSRLRANGKHYRLVFAWRSSVDGPVNPAACIDNILIADARSCRPPKKLNIAKHGSDSLIMSWRRDTCCQQYEVGCYSYEDSVWIINETTDTFFVHTGVPEGFCDFYVRTKCLDTITDDYFYSAKVQASEFIYYPDNHCVDYITMTDENCYISSVKTSSVLDDYKFTNQMVDNGSDEISSRHTHHYSKIEVDPRTGGRLKTVPAGELCSSRLGNWNNGGEAERAEFKFFVDAEKNPILILKYAVVLESPGHDLGKHPGDPGLADPRFTMNVLLKGHSIGDCAKADFTSSWVKEGWHDTTVNVIDGDKISTKNVVWKDWTTVGINLREYDGETLTIQLTTYDCSMTAHFGYAYFVLGCASDDMDMKGQTCTGEPMLNFTAPSGFNYKWYQKGNPLKIQLSDQQQFTVNEFDTATYCVDVIFPEDPNCHFTLEASSQPHFIQPDWTWRYTPKNCQHYVTIANKAQVMHLKKWKDDAGNMYRDSTYTDVDTCYWDWGTLDGQAIQPGDSLVIPIDTSGSYPIALTATYKKCIKTYFDTIRIPDLDTTSFFLDTLLLNGDSILFGGIYRKQADTFDIVNTNYQGCEQPSRLILRIHENLSIQCDSVSSICYQDTRWLLPYTLTGMRDGARYSLHFADPTLPRFDTLRIPAAGHDTLVMTLPSNLQPDYYTYTLTFHDSLIGTDPKIENWVGERQLCVRYPDSVMTQRWNDVLAIKKAEYNAGNWSFTAYQWYKNGVPIPEATGSYLYQTLDVNSEYQVLLTRADGVQIMSCAYVPQQVSVEKDMPTIVIHGAQIPMRQAGVATWFNCAGHKIQCQTFDNTSIVAPIMPGIYLLQLQSMPNGNIPEYRDQVVRIMVR